MSTTEALKIQDPALAIYLARLEGKMDVMRTTNEHVGRQVDQLAQDFRYVSTSSAKGAALDELDRSVTELAGKVNRILYFSAGMSALGTALIGILIWIASQQIQNIKTNADKIRDIEIHLTSDPNRPFVPVRR